jgi:hypothetical protein
MRNARRRLIEPVMHSPRLSGVREAAAPAVRATYRTRRPVVASRHELPFLLNRRRLLGLGFELGVAEAAFSELLLDRWCGRLLVSVDPWLQAPAAEYRDIYNVDQRRQDEFHVTARARLARFGRRSEIWRMTSSEAAARVLDASADFVYVDARHDFASVLEDLEHWYPKVRPGGILAGHDYLDGKFPEGEFGVKSAVDSFFTARGHRVSHTFLDRPWRSWLVSIPT